MNEISQGEFHVASESDIVTARRLVRNAATDLGFSLTDVTRIVTAASELTRNIYQYAGAGVMRWQPLRRDARVGLELTFEDRGPGIPDVQLAMQEGYSTATDEIRELGFGAGMGLPNIQRNADAMEIDTEVGRGTRLRATVAFKQG